MASDGTLDSPSSYFSEIWANTFKALETFVDEVDDWLVLVDIVCVLFWLYCLTEWLHNWSDLQIYINNYEHHLPLMKYVVLGLELYNSQKILF